MQFDGSPELVGVVDNDDNDDDDGGGKVVVMYCGYSVRGCNVTGFLFAIMSAS